MNSPSTLTPATQALLAEAAEWHLIGLLFHCPSSAWKEQLIALATEVRDPDLHAAVRHAVAEAAEETFHSIFGPGGPAPAREASYQATIQLGQLLSELNAYYNAFAYTPPSGAEPLDHVSVEAGFISFLRLKQAFALENESESEVAVTAEAADRFLEEHLSNMAEPLSYALDHSGTPYLQLAGRALLRRAGPVRKQVFDILDQDAPDAEESILECGES